MARNLAKADWVEYYKVHIVVAICHDTLSIGIRNPSNEVGS